jgi:hypothetical protein
VGGILADPCPFWIEDSSKHQSMTEREGGRERERKKKLSLLPFLSTHTFIFSFGSCLLLSLYLSLHFCPLFLLFFYFS